MTKVIRYRAKVDYDEDGEDIAKLGLKKIAFVKRPAVRIKGLAFASQEKELLFSADEVKMRIAAPVIVPGIFPRDATEKHPAFEVEFTAEDAEKTLIKFMSDPENFKNPFNTEHGEDLAPAFILEIWVVKDPETDKSFLEYGIKCIEGSVFAVAQITDRAYYDQLVEEGVTSFSLQGDFGFELQMSEEKKDYADVLVVNEEGKILMLKRTSEDEFEPNAWGFPGGKIEPGESPEAAAARELKEETGIEAGELTFAEEVKNEDGTTTHYFTTESSGEGAGVSEEHTELKFVDGNEMDNLQVILTQNERFKRLYMSISKQTKNKFMEEGEKFQIGENWFIVKDGQPVKCNAEGEIEMAAEEGGKEEPEEKEEGEKNVEMELEDPGTKKENPAAMTEEKIVELIQKTVAPMIEEGMKAMAEASGEAMEASSDKGEDDDAKEKALKFSQQEQDNAVKKSWMKWKTQ